MGMPYDTQHQSESKNKIWLTNVMGFPAPTPKKKVISSATRPELKVCQICQGLTKSKRQFFAYDLYNPVYQEYQSQCSKLKNLPSRPHLFRHKIK